MSGGARRRLSLFAAGCFALIACSRPAPIVIAPASTTEQQILAEIVAQTLQRRGVTVEIAAPYPSLATAHQALLAHAADITVEYSGAAWMTVLQHDAPPDMSHLQDRVRSEYGAFQLQWFDSLGFSDPFTLWIPQAEAARQHLETISQAARAQVWNLALARESLIRPDAFPLLMAAYPELRWTHTPDRADPPQLYQALAAGSANMVLSGATDGAFSPPQFCVLADDRHRMMPEQASIVARFDTVPERGAAEKAITSLAGKISAESMHRMNAEVDIRHRTAHDVAAEFVSRL